MSPAILEPKGKTIDGAIEVAYRHTEYIKGVLPYVKLADHQSGLASYAKKGSANVYAKFLAQLPSPFFLRGCWHFHVATCKERRHLIITSSQSFMNVEIIHVSH